MEGQGNRSDDRKNCTDILRVFLDPTDYRLPACHDSAIPEEVK